MRKGVAAVIDPTTDGEKERQKADGAERISKEAAEGFPAAFSMFSPLDKEINQIAEANRNGRKDKHLPNGRIRNAKGEKVSPVGEPAIGTGGIPFCRRWNGTGKHKEQKGERKKQYRYPRTQVWQTEPFHEKSLLSKRNV